MRLHRLLLAFLLLPLPVSGCLTQPVLSMPDTYPPIVKTYRSVTLSAGRAGMMNTRVHLEEGDLYSLFASGEMDYCSRGGCKSRNVTPDMGWPVLTRVGDDVYGRAFYGRSGTLDYAGRTGDLYVGYRQGPLFKDGTPKNPQWYRNDAGAFYIDIIVWAREDYDAIVAFLETLSERSPDNRALRDGFLYANHLRSLYVDAQKATQEIEATKREIASLKSETGQTAGQAALEKRPAAEGSASPEAGNEPTKPVEGPLAPEKEAAEPLLETDKQERLTALEAKLSKLQETLDELERMEQDLAEERQKTEQLSQELGEMEQREKDLRVRLEKGSPSPPVVVIASPEDGGTVEVNIVGLRGVVEDDQGIETIEIFVNGRRLHPGSERGLMVVGESGGKRHSFLEKIPLKEGENRIRIRAVDTDGLAVEKRMTLQCVRQRKKIWAVVVGINEYAHIRPLRFAVNDAKAFYRHLLERLGIPEENVTLLLDEQADLTRLRSVLGTQLKNRAGKDDMVILYFAGHGATERDVMSPDGDGLEKYLLPHGADLNDLYASALPMREIQHVFNRIRSERLVFIVDSCYSGASAGRTVSLAGLRANLSDAFLERITSGKGRVILSASGANEVSEENETLGHGIFTYYLLEGLRGEADADGDGLVTVDEAYGYVSRHVPEATGQEQHPVKKGSVEGRLVIGIRP